MNRHTTKEHLADTFIDLLKSNGIEEVSVSKLCKKSNVSRETFYYHFKDKYDLIEWIYCSQKRMILDKYYGTEPWSETISRVLSLIRNHASFYKKGFSDTAYLNLEKAMHDYTIKIFTISILSVTGERELSDEMKFYIEFDTNGAVAATKRWVETGMLMDEKLLGYLIAEAMPIKMKQHIDRFVVQGKRS